MWAKYILLAGICAALAMSVAVTVPYFLVWDSYNVEGRGMNVVTLKGDTYVLNPEFSNTIVNVTLIAVYPKASVYAYDDVFSLRLFLFVQPDADITSFFYFSGDVDFRSLDRNYAFTASLSPEFPNDFYKYSASGNIAPFLMNYSALLWSGRRPPIHSFDPWYFAGTVQVFPHIALNGGVKIHNSSYVTVSFLFDAIDSPVTIYCFNYPQTLWATYGSSMIIGVVVSINYLLARKRLNESQQANHSLAQTQTSKQ